jgi:hypothetical protein
MPKNIEPNLKLISKYLSLEMNENFLNPEYQRAYSWDTEQCNKLWQDIETFIESDGKEEYFFGTIIIDCSHSNKMSLIDGQQRTTTFLLLLKALLIQLNITLENISSDEETEGLKTSLVSNRNTIIKILYKVEDESIPKVLKNPELFSNKIILENVSINELFPDEVSKILSAVDFDQAEKNTHKFPHKQKLNKYTNQFRNFKFFYDELGRKSQTQLNTFSKIFLNKCQVIEIRSWQIEQSITMFNSLNSTGLPLTDSDIISAQLYSKSHENRDIFNQEWEKINKLCSLLEASGIVSLDSVLQQLMYIIRAEKVVETTTPGLRRFYTDIRKDLLEHPLDLCKNLHKIAKSWEVVKDYPVVKLLLKFNENTKLYLASYLYRFDIDTLSEKDIDKFCLCLVRLFTLLELSDMVYSSTKFKTFLFGQNPHMIDPDFSTDRLEENFTQHIRNTWTLDEVSESILEYNRNSLVFLYEYLECKDKGVPFYFNDDVNIEHIMPRSGRNISTIQRDAQIGTKEEFEAVVNKLGNKLLLEADINRSISNEWFKTKKQTSIKHKTGYQDSHYQVAKEMSNLSQDNWTRNDIENFTQKISQRITKFIFDGY